MCKSLEKFNIQINWLFIFMKSSLVTYQRNWLTYKLKFVNLHWKLFTHCYAHHLSIVLQQSCFKIKYVKIFFSTIQGIPGFFHHSSKRTAVVDKILDSKCIPTSSEVRWNSNSKIISAVHTNILQLIEVFKELMESQDSVTVWEAQVI